MPRMVTANLRTFVNRFKTETFDNWPDAFGFYSQLKKQDVQVEPPEIDGTIPIGWTRQQYLVKYSTQT